MRYLLSSMIAASTMLLSQTPVYAQSDDDGVRKDAAELAKYKSISISEAIRRIDIQNKFNQYLQSYASDSFISGDIESTSTVFKLHLRVSPRGIKNVLTSQLMIDKDLSSLIQVETAPFTPAELRSAETAVFNALGHQDAVTRIDARTGKLVLQMRDTALASALISRLGLGDRVAVEQRSIFPKPVSDLGGYLGGGLSILNSNGGKCTTGFMVKQNNTPKVLTAGHCVLASMGATFTSQGATIDGNIAMSYTGAAWSGSQDFSWLYTSTTSPSSNIFIGTGPRKITAGYYTSNAASRVAIGTSLCKYGRSTGYTCADVVNNNYRGVDISGNNFGPQVELGGTTVNIAQCGDSGGPVFSGGTGYGITSRGDANGTCMGGSTLIYAPLDYSTPLYIY